MHLTSHITHSNGYAPYIAYYRSNGYDQRFRKLKPKPKLNPPNAHRSQIKICENRQTQNVQFRLMPNAFRILKPIQKSSKRVWVFRNTGANAFAKNQMRLAYEDKRDLYCNTTLHTGLMLTRGISAFVVGSQTRIIITHDLDIYKMRTPNSTVFCQSVYCIFCPTWPWQKQLLKVALTHVPLRSGI